MLFLIERLLTAFRCYSAQEFSALRGSNVASTQPIPSTEASPSNPYPSLSPPSTISFSSLPLDITIETLISVALLCLGIVLGSEELQPISWRVWAGKVESEKGHKKDIGTATEEGFLWLEDGRRKGFLDIRAQRKEFTDWVKGQSG